MILEKEISPEYSSTRIINICRRSGIKTYENLLLISRANMMRINGVGVDSLNEVDDMKEVVFSKLHERADSYVSHGNNARLKKIAYLDGALDERRRILEAAKKLGIDQLKNLIYEI